MGKKGKSTKGALRAKERKLDKTTLPPPPKPVGDEVSRIYKKQYLFLFLNYYSTYPFSRLIIRHSIFLLTTHLCVAVFLSSIQRIFFSFRLQFNTVIFVSNCLFKRLVLRSFCSNPHFPVRDTRRLVRMVTMTEVLLI